MTEAGVCEVGGGTALGDSDICILVKAQVTSIHSPSLCSIGGQGVLTPLIFR